MQNAQYSLHFHFECDEAIQNGLKLCAAHTHTQKTNIELQTHGQQQQQPSLNGMYFTAHYSTILCLGSFLRRSRHSLRHCPLIQQNRKNLLIVIEYSFCIFMIQCILPLVRVLCNECPTHASPHSMISNSSSNRSYGSEIWEKERQKVAQRR